MHDNYTSDALVTSQIYSDSWGALPISSSESCSPFYPPPPPIPIRYTAIVMTVVAGLFRKPDITSKCVDSENSLFVLGSLVKGMQSAI